LPGLLTGMAASLEEMLYQLVFFLIYLMFWICEPLPVSGAVMQVFKSYLLLKTIVCFIFAIACSFLLWILDCQIWPLYFVITFVLNYIPEVGAIACAVLMVPVILLNGNVPEHCVAVGKLDGKEAIPHCVVFHNLDNLLWLCIGFALIKIITGNVIEVKLYAEKGGQFMRMHPVILLALIMVCSALLGLTGAFLSVPVMAAVKYGLLAANMPHAYLDPLLVIIEGDEMSPHRNFVDRRRADEAEARHQKVTSFVYANPVSLYQRCCSRFSFRDADASLTSVRSVQVSELAMEGASEPLAASA